MTNVTTFADYQIKKATLKGMSYNELIRADLRTLCEASFYGNETAQRIIANDAYIVK